MVGRVLVMPKVLKKKVLGICRLTKEIAQDDPRKVIHSLKVGLAILLVSPFYYYQSLYENFGLSAMWAVMTVVVIFEYTAIKPGYGHGQIRYGHRHMDMTKLKINGYETTI